MPQMKMNRNRTVATTRGHTVRFTRGELTHVPDDAQVIELCKAAGAEYADPAQAPDLPDRPEATTPSALTSAQRKEKVFTLFQEMTASPTVHREHFTAFGRPSAKYVATTLGIDISAKEVEEFWTVFQAKQ